MAITFSLFFIILVFMLHLQTLWLVSELCINKSFIHLPFHPHLIGGEKMLGTCQVFNFSLWND